MRASLVDLYDLLTNLHRGRYNGVLEIVWRDGFPEHVRETQTLLLSDDKIHVTFTRGKPKPSGEASEDGGDRGGK